MGLLSLTLALPLLGAVALFFTAPEDHVRVRWTALVASLLTLAAAVAVLVRFETGTAGFQLEEQVNWIPQWGISYHLGVDGISLFLVLLTAFLTPLVVLSAWELDDRARGYFAAFLVLETASLGVFLALDLVLFYVFFDLTLVPMYLLIGVWGYERRRYASVKFFLYTFIGGLLMLVGIIALYAATGAESFDYLHVSQFALDTGLQRWLFAAFSIAFLIKIPVFPVHTWLPDAHTEAPTGGSVMLAAVLLKLGGYGLLRFSLPLFPDAAREAVPLLLTLAVIGIIYGALVALVQRDLKKLVAYSSVSHMGFVVLGIFALRDEAVSGGVVQMINHGLSTGALFFLVGFLYQRRHTRQIAAFGGLAASAPRYAGVFLVVALSSLALPGLNGFVGEFPILLGAFQTNRLAGAVAALGMILAAVYLLWAYQRVFHGPLETADNEHTRDLDHRELAVVGPLVAVIVLVGLFPQPLFDRIEPSVDALVARVNGTVEAAEAAPIIPVGQR